MRKLILYGMFAGLLAVAATAQESPVDKGSMMIGGVVFIDNFSGDMYGNDAMTIIEILPSLGYFISPGLLIGADFTFTSMSQGGDSDTFYGIGPMVRYYFGAKKDRSEIKGAMFPYLRAFMIYVDDGDDNFTSFGPCPFRKDRFYCNEF